MSVPLTISPSQASYTDLFTILAQRGDQQYGGEAVTQLQHALQSAELAFRAGAEDELIAAALFHDLGHLVHDLGEDATEQGIDDRHEYRAVRWLKQVFPESVWQPVAMHVEAKRYLCASSPGYAAQLSAESMRSLVLQGGVMDEQAQRQFTSKPFWREACQLRRWDDLAKDPEVQTQPLDFYRQRLAYLALNPS